MTFAPFHTVIEWPPSDTPIRYAFSASVTWASRIHPVEPFGLLEPRFLEVRLPEIVLGAGAARHDGHRRRPERDAIAEVAIADDRPRRQPKAWVEWAMPQPTALNNIAAAGGRKRRNKDFQPDQITTEDTSH